MRIDNAQLAAFSAVLREGTFELASQKLHVTPSAISQRIKLLEDRLGQVLIQRTTPCQATAAGKVLLRYTEEITLLEFEVFSCLGVTESDGKSSARIPIAVNADSLDSWFLGVFDSLATSTSITIDLKIEDQDHSIALLRDGTVMAGVSASALPIQGCRVDPIGVMRYLAVASPQYVDRYLSGKKIGLCLNTAPMLMFNAKDGLQDAFLRLLAIGPVSPSTHCIPSTRSFLEAAQRGVGWGMMPEQIVLESLNSGKLVEISPANWIDVPLFWHRWRIESAALDMISKIISQVAANMLRPHSDAARI